MFKGMDSKVFGGTMLIAGTTIGGAMLAMPVMTGLFGFFGTVAIMFACWLFMYWTATLILESTLHFEEGASFVTMAKGALGNGGAVVTWVTFLLLFYSLVAAYLSGSGKVIMDALEAMFNLELPPFIDILPLLIMFAPFIYFGLTLVDKLNRWLMMGMFISYAIIALWLIPKMSYERLSFIDWRFSLLSFSVVVTSFGYQVIIPSLAIYLKRDVEKIKKCMFYGSFIPFVLYVVWEAGILGALPVSGENGLAHAFSEDIPLGKLLHIHLNSGLVATMARAFSIFAIVTSFLGVAQGLFDFLKDGINAGKSHKKRTLAFALTFLPPILLVLGFSGGFIGLLEYAGALVAIILGIIPILIVWRLRSQKKSTAAYRAPGNNVALFFGLIFFTLVVLIVVLKNLGVVHFVVETLI